MKPDWRPAVGIASSAALALALLLFFSWLAFRGSFGVIQPDLEAAKDVVQLVKTGEIVVPKRAFGESYALPSQYAAASVGGEVAITQDGSRGVLMVEFWLRRGMGNSELLVYLEGPADIGAMAEEGAQVQVIERKWFLVET